MKTYSPPELKSIWLVPTRNRELICIQWYDKKEGNANLLLDIAQAKKLVQMLKASIERKEKKERGKE